MLGDAIVTVLEMLAPARVSYDKDLLLVKIQYYFLSECIQNNAFFLCYTNKI